MVNVVHTIEPPAAPIAARALPSVLVINISLIMSARRVTFTFTPSDGRRGGRPASNLRRRACDTSGDNSCEPGHSGNAHDDDR